MKITIDKQDPTWYNTSRAVNNTAREYGGLAQLGEHLPYKQEVTGSSPVVPTI